MADTSTTALNIGSQRIAMAQFSAAKGGNLNLTKYAATSILADPAMDAARLPQVQTAIAQLVNGLKLKNKDVRYAISGQAAITRFVKLPPLDDDQLEQTITFEAQQVIPIPLDQIIWDYQVLETGGIEKEVVIVAIRGDQLNEINDAVVDASVRTAEVDVSPMALFNAFKFNYPQLTDSTVLVDIGAKTTNLIYIDGDRFFVRSVNVGGASVTSAIAKDYSVDFAQAEEYKTQNGLVALGGQHTSQLDEQTAALATTIRNALGKLPAEISRTTTQFRSQHGGNAPARILLAGGGANLAYTKEFLEEKLNLPVEVFNPLQRVTIGGGVDQSIAAGDAHMMGELVGLAVRPLGKAPLKIELVPDSVASTRAEKSKRPLLLAGAALLLGALAGYGFFKKGQADEAEEIAQNMMTATQQAAGPAAAIKKLENQEGQIDQQVNELFNAEKSRTRWLDILNSLSANFAHDAVWVTSMAPMVNFDPTNPNANGSSLISEGFSKNTYGSSAMAQLRVGDAEPRINAVRIKGFWRQNPESEQVVYKLVRNLRENATDVFTFKVNQNGEETELKDTNIIRSITASAAADNEDYAFPFELVLPLKETVKVD